MGNNQIRLSFAQIFSTILLPVLSLTMIGMGNNTASPKLNALDKSYKLQDEDSRGPYISEPVYPVVFEGDVRELPPPETPFQQNLIPRLDVLAADQEPQFIGKDPLLQEWRGEIDMPTPDLTFPGVDRVGWGAGWPPDTNGDVGPKHYIQTVNTSLAIFDKTSGTMLAAFTFNTFFNGTGTPCDTNNNGDVIVLYDHLADRWVLTDFAWTDQVNGPYYECVAISRTGDPVSGGWYQYVLRADDASHPWLNDYPKLGVWPDGYYMSANMFDITVAGSSYEGVRVWALDRTSILSGGPLSAIYFDLPTAYFSLLPSNLRGPEPPAGSPSYFAAISQSTSAIQLWEFDVDWDTPSNSTFSGPTTLAVTAFSSGMTCSPTSRDCIPQLGTTQRLDAISRRLMMQAQYRNFGTHESLWLNHTVDVDTGNDIAGIRWYELRELGGTPTVYQQASHGSSGAGAVERWMGSLAADRMNNMALGYSASSEAMYPDIRYAGRLVTDTLNTLGQAESVFFPGTGHQNDNGASNNWGARWGDYSAMTVDPDDDCTFWYTTEYYDTTDFNGNWKTRIGSFRYPSCTSSKHWVGTTSASWDEPSNWSPVGVPTRYDDVLIDNSPPPTFWPDVDVDAAAHNLTIADSALLNASADFILKVFGDWTQTGSGAFNATNGTVLLLGREPTLNMGTPGESNHFNNLRLGDGNFTPEVTLGSNLRVDGDFMIHPGTIFNPGSATVETGGNFTALGKINPGTSTLSFIGAQSHVLSNTAQTTTSSTLIFSENFESWPLSGWNIANNGGDCVWRDSNDGSGTESNLTGGSGNYADADSDDCGRPTTMDTDLQTPVLDLSSIPNPRLEFKSDMRWWATDQWDVDLSLDGGSTWPTNLLHRDGASFRGPETISLNLSAAGGQSNVRIRFRYRGDYDYWWQVDEVRIYNDVATPLPTLYDVLIPSSETAILGQDLAIGNNLTIQSNATFNLSTSDMTVEGSLSNNGTLVQSVANLAAYTRFLNIQDIAGSSDKYFGVDITPAASMGATTVQIRGNQAACDTNGDLIHRCYDIAPTTSQSATIRYWYLISEAGAENPAQMRAYHWESPGWSELTLASTPRGSSGSYEWVEAVNVTSYSPFGLADGDPTGPTAIVMTDIGAYSYKNSLPIFLLFVIMFCVGTLSLLIRRRHNN